MSTEGYSETFPQMAGPNPRMGSKRKRGPADSHSNVRSSPMTRRNQANFNMNQSEDTSGGAPTASMNDTNNYLHQSPFESALPHLQPSTARGHDSTDNSNVDTAAAALNYSMQVPPHPADTFMAQAGAGEGDHSAYEEGNTSQFHADGGDGEDGEDGSGKKPDVGSDEWQRMRKDNHKEVERRRRETINEGINELAKIVPGCEKNKGSILARAVQYIQKLHDEASQNIDKWTFEKLVTEQAINDLSGKLQRAWAEKEAWKRVAREAGVAVEDVELGIEAGVEGKGDEIIDGINAARAPASTAEGEATEDDDHEEEGEGEADGEDE